MASGDDNKRASADAGSSSDDSRRDFLKTVGIGGIGLGLAAVTVGPAVVYETFPLGNATVSGGGGFVKVGKSSSFKEGVPLRVDVLADRRDAWNRVSQVKIGSAWILRQGDKLRAFSSVCPHLGCAFDFEPDVKQYKCPCHNAIYSIDGKVAGGPAPRPMDELELQEKDGIVSVKYERFRQNIATKELA
jgi:Rieske Fe-S protein